MSGSLQAWYSLGDLETLASRHTDLSGELSLSRLSRLKSLLHDSAGSVKASLRFRQRGGGMLDLELDFDAAVELDCQRCLEPFTHRVAEHVELALLESEALERHLPPGTDSVVLEEGRLNPAQLVEDELIVALPLVPKHERIEECGSLARALAAPTDDSTPGTEAADRNESL